MDEEQYQRKIAELEKQICELRTHNEKQYIEICNLKSKCSNLEKMNEKFLKIIENLSEK